MSSDAFATTFPRRDFLKAGGALLVGLTFAPRVDAQQPPGGALGGPFTPDPEQLDTWIAIHADNTATIFLGYVELGQGNSTALLQIAAEELDLDMSQVSTARVETGKSPNQGGTNASASINRGGPRIRLAAADARQALLARASEQLGAPVERLTVSRGVVSVVGNPGRSATYGGLIGDRRFDVPYTARRPSRLTAITRSWEQACRTMTCKSLPRNSTWTCHRSRRLMLRLANRRTRAERTRAHRSIEVDRGSVSRLPMHGRPFCRAPRRDSARLSSA